MTLFNKISDNVWEIGVIPEDIALLRHQISENYPSTGGKKMIFNVSFIDEADEAWFVNLPLTEIRLYEIEHKNFGWHNTDIGTRFKSYYDAKKLIRGKEDKEAYKAAREEQIDWFRSNMAVR